MQAAWTRMEKSMRLVLSGWGTAMSALVQSEVWAAVTCKISLLYYHSLLLLLLFFFNKPVWSKNWVSRFKEGRQIIVIYEINCASIITVRSKLTCLGVFWSGPYRFEVDSSSRLMIQRSYGQRWFLREYNYLPMHDRARQLYAIGLLQRRRMFDSSK